MEDREGLKFDPVAMREKLAARNGYFAACLQDSLYADEAAALMPGWMEWHEYRAIPPEEQDPPGLMPADFARAYRDIAHPGGILNKKRGE